MAQYMRSGRRYYGVEAGSLATTEGSRSIDLVVFDERFLKVEYVDEIFQMVVLGFSHFAGFDKFEDNFSEIFSAVDAPFSEDGECHQAEVLWCEFANAFDEFPSTYVTRIMISSVAAMLFLSMSQRCKNEVVSVRMIASRWR